tara:strand:- start:527 stop:670 length:144 start_codon:yes stop_codon:yes gene_type:complete
MLEWTGYCLDENQEQVATDKKFANALPRARLTDDTAPYLNVLPIYQP